MAATLDELLAQYQAQQRQASSIAEQAGSAASVGLAAAGGATGLIGAIMAPVAARYLGDAFGLNRRSSAEEAALGRIKNVAEGGQTAAQAALEYQRARAGRMQAQAAAMGPARERAARQLVGQEQNIAAQQDITGQLAQVKMQEQALAQQALAGIETRAGEAERQRQRQMVSGAVSGGLGALTQAYGGYLASQQRAKDLQAQAAGAQAAVESIQAAKKAPPAAGATQGTMSEATAPLSKAMKDEAKIKPDYTSKYMPGAVMLDQTSQDGVAAAQRGREAQRQESFGEMATAYQGLAPPDDLAFMKTDAYKRDKSRLLRRVAIGKKTGVY